MLFWWKVRRFLRFATPPIEERRANRWDRRLRFAYIFFAWNAFGLAAYLSYNRKHSEKNDESSGNKKTASETWATLLNAKNPTFVKVSGVSVKQVWKNDDEITPETTAETMSEGLKL